MPDSLLSAAKLTAELAGVAAYDALKTFRSLQEREILPVSKGKRVWPAVPTLCVRFMVHLICRAQPESAEPLCMAREPAEGLGYCHLFDGLAPFLASSDLARQLGYVELNPTEARTFIVMKESVIRRFEADPDFPPPAVVPTYFRANLILPGALFVAVADAVSFDTRPGAGSRLVADEAIA